jgi:hypothetical protein
MRRADAPAPDAIHNGAAPKINAKEVIRIGRKRKRRLQALRQSDLAPFPTQPCKLNDQNRVLCASPMSTISPI